MRPRGARAFTLLEALCVTVLLAVASAVVARSLSAMAQNTNKADSARRLIASVDAAARLNAVRGRPSEIVVTGSTLAARYSGSDTVFVSHEVEGLSLANPRTGEAMSMVPFNASGRGPDYAVVHRSRQAVTRFMVCGATGWVETVSSTELPQ